MDLGTIEISPEEAKQRLAEIEQVLVAERTVEDEALAAAYRAAGRGHGVISLRRAFETAGQFDDGMPRLAVVGALVQRCRVDLSYSHDPVMVRYQFSDDDVRSTGRRSALVGKNHVTVRCADTLGRRRTWGDRSAGRTIVPSIPARFRPNMRRLRHMHILWEVEKWDPTPPVDPALVRHIRGDLWAVIATWDLTELERLILTGRA